MAPRNFGSACLGGRNDRISVECLNLIHQGGAIPLGMAPRNAYPACPARPVAPEDGTGVGSENRTGACLRAPRLPRLPRSSGRWYWGSSGRWYWGEIHISDSVAYFTGAQRSLCLMKQVLRLDVGRWSRILKV